MNRRERRKAERELRRMEKLANKLYHQAIEAEKERVRKAFGLDKEGRNFQLVNSEVDTIGSISSLYMGDLDGDHIKYAAITASPAKPEYKQAFIEQLTHSYQALDMPIFEGTGDRKLYYGTKVKVVLSQIHGELWHVYLGAENLINRFIETGSIIATLAESGYSYFWNDWEVRIPEENMILWETLKRDLGGILFHIIERPLGEFIDGFDIFIPEENILIQRKGDKSVPYERQIYPK